MKALKVMMKDRMKNNSTMEPLCLYKLLLQLQVE